MGWTLGETLLGAPQGFGATLLFGMFTGLGIAAVLGAAEGIVIRSLPLARRGASIGLAVGAIGGMCGAAVAQLGYSVTTGSAAGGSNTAKSPGASVFSSAMRERLADAGAKSGEIEIGLIWEDTNDLDLHVVDPGNEEIFFAHRRSRTRGELDIDRNAGCGNDTTRSPVEHVVWPDGTAPRGVYEVSVHHFARCGPEDPTPFQVEIVINGQSETIKGSIGAGEPPVKVKTFTREESKPKVEVVQERPSLFAMLARVLGWAAFGGLVGCAQGLTRRSGQALRNAAIGGAIGGACGGVAFEFIGLLGLSDAWSRGLGFVILGACIGLWIVLIERALSAVLTVSSGTYEGREIYLDRPEMRLGRNDALEIFLGGDPEVSAHHATLKREGPGYAVSAAGGAVLVNGSSVARHGLRDGDLIQFGKTRVTYKERASKATPTDGTATSTANNKPAPVRTTLPPPPPPPPPRKK